MLGRTSNDQSAIETQIREILSVDVPEDGLYFLPDTIQSASITEDADYRGVRVRFQGNLEAARIAMQIDIGFGDIVYPAPETHIMPTFLDQPAPRILCYNRESAIAEKFEAMARLRELNSRMKDFYDIWQLSRQFDFDGSLLFQAIKHTFENRGTTMDLDFIEFSDTFAQTHQVQWKAFPGGCNSFTFLINFQTYWFRYDLSYWNWPKRFLKTGCFQADGQRQAPGRF